MSLKRSLALFGTALISAGFLIPSLPRSSTAQGILPPFRFGDPIRPLPLRIDRGFKSARSARYYFQVPDPELAIHKFIITEITNNFNAKGGRFNLKRIEIRTCSSLGNVLRGPSCEDTYPIKQITHCSEARGCQTYDPVADELSERTNKPRSDEPYEGLPFVEIQPLNPINPGDNEFSTVEEGTNFILVFSDVKNPRSAVDYQFNLAVETAPGRANRCDVITALGDCALGTWLVSIASGPNDI
jgi:hypothetical protein